MVEKEGLYYGFGHKENVHIYVYIYTPVYIDMYVYLYICRTYTWFNRFSFT